MARYQFFVDLLLLYSYHWKMQEQFAKKHTERTASSESLTVADTAVLLWLLQSLGHSTLSCGVVHSCVESYYMSRVYIDIRERCNISFCIDYARL